MIAHLEIEHCSSTSDLLHERDRGPSTEKIHLGFKTPHRKIPSWIQDLLTEKNDYPCILPLLILDHVLPYVFDDLALVFLSRFPP